MIYLSILAALFLFFALVMIARSLHSEPDLNIPGLLGSDAAAFNGRLDDANDAIHSEILVRVFGDDDQRFIGAMGDSRVERLLRFERKRIALSWIRRKVAQAQAIMCEHVRRAREAEDLKVSGEVRLALQYLELLALCKALALIVVFFGPAGLQSLAMQTNAILSGMRRLGESAVPDAGAVAS
jgi:hypothetical protein